MSASSPQVTPAWWARTCSRPGFPGNVASSTYVIIGERRDRQLTADDLLYLDSIADRMKSLQSEEPELKIKTVTDRRTPIIGSRMVGRLRRGWRGRPRQRRPHHHVRRQATRITVDRFEELMAELPDGPRGLSNLRPPAPPPSATT